MWSLVYSSEDLMVAFSAFKGQLDEGHLLQIWWEQGLKLSRRRQNKNKKN